MSGDKHLGAAISRLQKLQLQKCFDPFNPESRATPQQEEIFKDCGVVQYRWVVAGNRCLAEGTEVMTPEGPRPIETIKPGDRVYSENGEEIEVLELFDNGVREVINLQNRTRTWVECTSNHRFLTYGIDRNKKITDTLQETEAGDLRGPIARRFVQAPLGNLNVPYAYSLGALLGDGCSRQSTKSSIFISSSTPSIPCRVAHELGGDFTKLPSKGYTWRIEAEKPPLYLEWCEGRYAHEKKAPLDVIKNFDRESSLRFLAGVIDTDGSLVRTRDGYNLRIDMQALEVIEAVSYLLTALFQILPTRSVDSRGKYKNGPIHQIRVRNPHDIKRIMAELSNHMLCKYKSHMEMKGCGLRSFEDRVTLTPKESRLVRVYDLSVNSPTQLYLLANGLVTHNSGKSALAARELTWILQDLHPHFTRPDNWRNAPLTCLVAGKSRQGLENELWANKIKPFLVNQDDWKLIRTGNVLQSVENKVTGDRIIFLTHADASDRIIDNLQMYTAHYVWLDEMPKKMRVLEELQRRTDTTGGPFIATFTPKVVNNEIKQVVEASRLPVGKKYQIHKLQNPVYMGREKEELAKLAGYPEALKRTILYGDWGAAEASVYDFDSDTMSCPLPESYSPTWRHVESVDPATNTTGYTLWAEDPLSKIWYCVKSEYINIKDPLYLWRAVEAKSQGYNLVRRICDPHEVWYITTAHREGCRPYYLTVEDKNQGRKEELIKGLQSRLSHGKIKITHLCSDLIDELTNCQFREDGVKIVNASKYHLLDTAQYFCDLLPPPDLSPPAETWADIKIQAHHKRKKMEMEKQKLKKISRGRIRRRYRR